MNAVPVLGRNNRHAADGEIFVQPVKRRRGAAAPGADHRRRRFVGKGAAAGIKHPIQQSAQRAVRAGIIDRGPDHDAVGALHQALQLVGRIIFKHASAQRGTAAAGDAAAHRMVANMENFGFHTVFLQRFRHL